MRKSQDVIRRVMASYLMALAAIASVRVAYGFSLRTPGVASGVPIQAKAAGEQAGKWHSDARLVKVVVASREPQWPIVSFYFRSASSGDAYLIQAVLSDAGFTLSEGKTVPASAAGDGIKIDKTIPRDYDEVLKTAQKNGLKGDPGGEINRGGPPAASSTAP